MLTQWPVYGLKLDQFINNPIDFEIIFNRRAPTILDIGFGDGEALFEVAQKNPHQNYIGIEVYRPGIGHLLMRANQHALGNLRVFNDDGIEVLDAGISDNSLDKICLYFPDPWPKKKHHKRRIVQPKFIELVASKLKPEGIFHFASDWQDYAIDALEKIEATSVMTNLAGTGNYAPRPLDRPKTKFEKRGLRLGHGVWDIIMEKPAS